jgi:hypothetical protein
VTFIAVLVFVVYSSFSGCINSACDPFVLYVYQLTNECSDPEWNKWYINYGRCDVDEPVG